MDAIKDEWSRATGAHEVHGAIDQEYRRIGGTKSLLGFPTSDETAGAAGTGAAGAGGAGGGGAAADMSHCDKSGRQIGPRGYVYMPPCAPVWHGGDNGGATMTGVDATHINYVLYASQSNAQVNAILATQGLAATAQQGCEGLRAFNTEVNKRWEHYGRTFVSLDGPGANKGSAQNTGSCHTPFFQGQCQLTPPDPPCNRAEAKVVAAMHPAIVLAPIADTAFYDELTKDHVIVVGGGEAPESYYDQASPYLYGLLMDGTRQALIDAEYWCRKLNAKPASHAGADVTTARGWGNPPTSVPIRKLAISFPENNGDEVFKLSVDYFKSLVTGKMCNTPGGVLELPYASDINTAQQQSQNAVQQMIQNHITTSACWCDPIAPAFGTATEQSQGYFPEQWILGVGLIDYDQLGRLYAPQEWAHAFGASDLALSRPFADSDAPTWFQDAGDPGEPVVPDNAVTPFFSLMGSGFQLAGPRPTPDRIHQGLMGAPTQGGWALTHDQHLILVGFKPPSPFTAAEDTREVYWSQSRPSEVDNKPGSYCPVAGGHRYNLGEWPGGDPDVFDPATNGC